MSFNLPRNKIIVLSVSAIICIMLNVLCLYILSLRPLNSNALHIVSMLILIVSPIFLIIAGILIYENEKNLRIDIDNRLSELGAQKAKEYYDALLKKDEDTRAFYSDIRDDILQMNRYIDLKNFNSFNLYLEELSQSISLLSPTVDTGNHMVSSIASDISGKYPDVAFTCDGHMPPKPDIALSDICIIFSNALSNAFEAACQVDKPYVNMYIKTSIPSRSVFVSVENPFSNKPVWSDPDTESVLITSKKEPGHGYGFANLKKAVKRNGGICKNEIITKDGTELFRLTFTFRYLDH